MAFGLGSLVMIVVLLATPITRLDIEARAILAWAFTGPPAVTESKMLCTCDPSCQCGCWTSGKCDCAVKAKLIPASTPASYKDVYEAAIRERKDLVIWVNMRPTQHFSNVIHWSCDRFQGDSTPRLFRAYFYDGKLWDAPAQNRWVPVTHSRVPARASQAC